MRRRTVFAGVAVAALAVGIALAIQGVSGADKRDGSPDDLVVNQITSDPPRIDDLATKTPKPRPMKEY